VHQTDHHIRHLHAGVVDVVLHSHALARSPQEPHKRIAQDGVAQMSDVRRLVRVDAGVLDQRVNAHAEAGVVLGLGNRRQRRAPVEPGIQVARAGYFKTGKTGQRLRVQRLHQLRGDLFRRAAQRTRQLKGHRRRVIAQRHLRRLLYVDLAGGAIRPASHRRSRIAVAFAHDAAQSLAQNLLHVSVQWRVLAAAAHVSSDKEGPRKP
jgi:hypothetical protein